MNKILSVLLSAVLLVSVMLPAVSVSAAETEPDTELAEVGLATLKINAVEATEDGVIVMWERVDAVAKYRVERDDGKGWTTLGSTAKLYWVDDNAKEGESYRYRVTGLSETDTALTTATVSDYNFIRQPQILSVEILPEGNRVQWEKPAGVPQIALYRKVENGWKRITTSSGTSFVDTGESPNGEYRYTIRGLSETGEFLHDTFDRAGVTVKRLATPQLTAQAIAGGVNVSWQAVANAEAYRVFSKLPGGEWKRLGDVTGTSFTDTAALSGMTYTYTVRCISADGKSYTSYFDKTGKTVSYVAAPKLLSAAGNNDGVQVKWQPSDGAAKYRVFRRENGTWRRLSTVDGTAYQDKSVQSGNVYTYTVRCVDDRDQYNSAFYSEGVSCSYVSSPVLSSVACGADGVVIRWDAVEGAVKYRVYYKSENGWTRFADTAETSVVDTHVTSGSTYTYTVRCINENGTAFMSGFHEGKSVRYIAAPTILSITGASNGLRIYWEEVEGAELYRVYVRGENGWTKLTDTTDTSYMHTGLVSGKTYSYTVRCLTEDGKRFTSYYKPGVEKRFQFLDAPQISSLAWGGDHITVKWNAVEGAELYRVYLRTGNTWTKLTDTADTTFVDENVELGVSYTYTVRCLSADASYFMSDFLPGKSIRYLNTPHITEAAGTEKGVAVRWTAVEGATKYRLYVREGSSWKRIVDTAATSYIHTGVTGTHIYTVRCINADGTAFESGFDPNPALKYSIASPVNLKAQVVKSTIKLSWDKSTGAERYRVFYRGANGWVRSVDTTGTSVTQSNLTSGETYTYTVRCVTYDGLIYTSDFDHDGVTVKYTDTPALKSAENVKNGVKITWNPSTGAEKYRVYVKGSNGWTKFAETTDTTATDTNVSSGKTYTYTVRCLTEDGKHFTSDFDAAGVKSQFVSPPQCKSIEATESQVTFSWSKPAGAVKFRVYKKVNGAWTRLGDTTSTSYTDYSVYPDTDYVYTVRCINSSGNAFMSSYDPDAFKVRTLEVVVPSGQFIYYDQGQYTYPYGDDTIAWSGCGPTCFAMIASTLTGRAITPIDAVKWCGNDYYVANVGTRWDYFVNAADHFGISCTGQYSANSLSYVVEELRQGRYVISSHKAGRFTSGGHFIVLAGLDAKGKIIVYDPNGWNGYIGTSFTADEIAESATQYWVFDK